MSIRGVASVKASHDQEQEILVAQRKNRPLSPDLTIYKPQLTWVLSGLHRVTGVAMAGGFYALTCGYAASSIFGLGLDSAALVSAFTALPLGVQFLAKAVMSYPFVFHSFNGIRHLVWDTGRELTLKGVYRTGYVVLGLTATLGSYLIFY
ncbi:cytochrome b560 subunit of succinate dehydrogenase [Suhomyces tanzawaensis NRRL Y-17324]|uniref:Cytochrome b560 subunit of succinate dehydrogenase n=1 Tax=Suhomyces tanzawaensis NRRL Y-17324 TaxID=984487 RepID=A0A1E4SCR1_9ASCO|nr:cytochrome b560 subunit of succinate dehydrogenase [Suhomyces tanzawaensis NRRL Y-17324]ODV77285.1 cytochrome b560 subunit of succinate dehydrogenase [Suhomyces tanzawaensis NRRL Y-17324]